MVGPEHQGAPSALTGTTSNLQCLQAGFWLPDDAPAAGRSCIVVDRQYPTLAMLAPDIGAASFGALLTTVLLLDHVRRLLDHQRFGVRTVSRDPLFLAWQNADEVEQMLMLNLRPIPPTVGLPVLEPDDAGGGVR